MNSSDITLVVIDFLPSWKGRGYTASIYLWSVENSEPDGWSGELYRHVEGVALQPVRRDRGTQTVVKRLSKQGVIFLTLEEAKAYMEGEGAYWAFRKGHPNCPAGLDPRQPTTPERLHWRIRRPATPLFDQYGQRSAA